MSLIDRLRGRRGRALLRPHEAAVLEAVAVALPGEGATLMRRQIDAVEHVQRLFSGSDVSLYRSAHDRGRSGPSAFPARPPELRLATVRLQAAQGPPIRARVDAVHGDVFSITFPAAPSADLRVAGVTMHTNPMDPTAGRPGEADSPLGSLPHDALAEYRRLAAARRPAAGTDTGLLAPDQVYGVETELGSLLVVGAVAADLVVVRVDDGRVFRVSTDGDEQPFDTIEAALNSGV